MTKTAAAANAPRRWGKRALVTSVVAVGLFLLAFAIGIVVAALSPDVDNVWTWAPLIFPALTSLVSTALLITAIVLAIRSLTREGRGVRAIIALVLSAVALLPIGAVAFGVSVLLTGNG